MTLLASWTRVSTLQMADSRKVDNQILLRQQPLKVNRVRSRIRRRLLKQRANWTRRGRTSWFQICWGTSKKKLRNLKAWIKTWRQVVIKLVYFFTAIRHMRWAFIKSLANFKKDNLKLKKKIVSDMDLSVNVLTGL